MMVENLREMLFWCTLINMGLLFLWFMVFTLAHDGMYRFQAKWFKIKAEQYDSIHYAGMALYKMGFILFNLVPYVALSIVT